MISTLNLPWNGSAVLCSLPTVGSFPGVATFSYLEMVWADFQ
jgi:hypothetical protein